MAQLPPSVMSPDADRAQRRVALGLGIASLFCWLLGPFALMLGLKARQRSPDGRASAAIILGGATTLVLALSLVAASTGLGMYLAANRGSLKTPRLAMPSLREVGRALSPRKAHQVVERVELSADQKQFVDAYGWPDSFVLGLEADDTRVEVWQYFRGNSDDPLLREDFKPCRISFINRKFRNVQHFEGSFTPLNLGYRPTEFDSSLTVEEIKQAFGKPSLTRDPTIDQFGKIEIFRYGEEAVFMFREGKLWSVVTLGVEV